MYEKGRTTKLRWRIYLPALSTAQLLFHCWPSDFGVFIDIAHDSFFHIVKIAFFISLDDAFPQGLEFLFRRLFARSSPSWAIPGVMLGTVDERYLVCCEC